ncbi:serine/threonine protein phosphatase [Citricoccus sp.]|uniref:serine/threonine protein phosphatase n=1 Tax=Citricoccus sp. TaxID=1978372 RepID=UPI00263A3D1F|nr:serine/threonine protein phosphatase [Citricoccus sp.]HRO31643.1 serine/threonine protein phosphatase [Citricoccus sp.]
MTHPMPTTDTFEHVRGADGEHVGYIHCTDDGRFVPFDLLQRRRGEPMELDEAEALLDGIGLSMLAEPWWLDEGNGERVKVLVQEVHRDRLTVARAMDDLSGPVAKAVDLQAVITVELPTDRLHDAASTE